MERQPVSSSNITAVGYELDSTTLEVEFRHGGVYQFYGVPENVYQELITAPSVGSYFARNIKNTYPYQRIG